RSNRGLSSRPGGSRTDRQPSRRQPKVAPRGDFPDAPSQSVNNRWPSGTVGFVHAARFPYDSMPPSSFQPSQFRWHRPLTDTGRSSLEVPSSRRAETSNSYGQILTSSVVIGGSSLVTMLAAIVRNKF